jgi:hypothetical protein
VKEGRQDGREEEGGGGLWDHGVDGGPPGSPMTCEIIVLVLQKIEAEA